jgi:hypothetical protein
MAYKDLIMKIEKRFGFRELPETAQIQFNNARQTPDELLEEWADGVLSLAIRAFGDLPENHMYQQEVVRFCQGTADKEAGSCIQYRPKNFEETIDKMRWHQHNHQVIYGRPPRREGQQVSPGSYNDGEARVCVIGATTGEEMSLKKEMGEVLSAQGKEMGEIKCNLAALSAQMAVMMEEVKKRGKRSPKWEKRVSVQDNKEALNYKGATHEA